MFRVIPMLSLLMAGFAGAQTAERVQTALPMTFDAYTCQDQLGRKISFYLSPAKDEKRLPLAVMIGGSGGQSVWTVRDGKVFGGLQNLLHRAGEGRFRVLVVEKPGVPFGFDKNQPGTAVEATKEFCEEHTLERWVEAIHAAIRASEKLPNIDASRLMVVGHSEGGIVAARLAALHKGVTHVASLAGGGPTQLYDFYKLFGREATLKTWEQIKADPNSATAMAWGHPHRRWTTFTATSSLEEALKSRAKFYVAQGSADTNSLPAAAEVLYATLVAKGRDVQLDWVEGGDHGFLVPGQQDPGAAFLAVLGRVSKWFLGE